MLSSRFNLVVALGLVFTSPLLSAPEIENRSPLNCERVLRVAEWGREHYGISDSVSFSAPAFSRQVFRLQLERFDPSRVLFLESEVEEYIAASQKHWANFLSNRDCTAFESEFNRRLQAGINRWRGQLNLLDWETIKKLPYKKNLSPAKVKGFASNAEELKLNIQRQAEYAVQTASPEWIRVFGGTVREAVESSLSEGILESDLSFLTVLTKSMLTAMDPFSSYLPPEEYQDFYDELSGNAAGIGIRVRSVPRGLFVDEIMPDSPAHKSGVMKTGDLITTLDGQNLKALSPREAKRLLRGLPGSSLKLGVEHSGKTETKTYVLTRQVFELEETLLSYRLLKPFAGKESVAVISIPSFYGKGGMNPTQEERSSSEDLKTILTTLSKRRNPPNMVVLDLRGNPGGFLEEAVTMSGFFIGNQVVVGVKDRASMRVLKAIDNQILYSGPLVAWIDGGTASAAEILAGALKDHQRALVVGSKRSYGKGSVQRLFHLDEGILNMPFFNAGGSSGVVKLTTSLFFSPMGHTPANGGISSHVVLPSMEASETYAPPQQVSDIAPMLEDSRVGELRRREIELKGSLSRLVREGLVLEEGLERPERDESLREALSMAKSYSKNFAVSAAVPTAQLGKK